MEEVRMLHTIPVQEMMEVGEHSCVLDVTQV